MNLNHKVGPFPVKVWGIAIVGGLMLGLYLRHRARSSSATTSDPNAALGALTNYTGMGMADPNAGMDSNGVISGLLQQNGDLLSYLLASAGGGAVPAISDPPTYGPTPSPTNTPTVTVASSSEGAAPAAVSDSPAPGSASAGPADPNYPNSTLVGSLVDTGTVTPSGLPIQETPAVAQGAQVASMATSSTGGIGGAGYLLLSDKTLRPTVGVNVAQ